MAISIMGPMQGRLKEGKYNYKNVCIFILKLLRNVRLVVPLLDCASKTNFLIRTPHMPFPSNQWLSEGESFLFFVSQGSFLQMI
jgi:hypothetical protein